MLQAWVARDLRKKDTFIRLKLVVPIAAARASARPARPPWYADDLAVGVPLKSPHRCASPLAHSVYWKLGGFTDPARPTRSWQTAAAAERPADRSDRCRRPGSSVWVDCSLSATRARRPRPSGAPSLHPGTRRRGRAAGRWKSERAFGDTSSQLGSSGSRQCWVSWRAERAWERV